MTIHIGVEAFRWLSFGGGFACGILFSLGIICIFALSSFRMQN